MNKLDVVPFLLFITVLYIPTPVISLTLLIFPFPTLVHPTPMFHSSKFLQLGFHPVLESGWKFLPPPMPSPLSNTQWLCRLRFWKGKGTKVFLLERAPYEENCKFLQEHFKGTKAMTGGTEAIPFCCLHGYEVSGLYCHPGVFHSPHAPSPL